MFFYKPSNTASMRYCCIADDSYQLLYIFSLLNIILAPMLNSKQLINSKTKNKMPKKKQPIEIPPPEKNPEYSPDVIPETPMLPEEEPDSIPEEEPFEMPPYEVPEPGENL